MRLPVIVIFSLQQYFHFLWKAWLESGTLAATMLQDGCMGLLVYRLIGLE